MMSVASWCEIGLNDERLDASGAAAFERRSARRRRRRPTPFFGALSVLSLAQTQNNHTMTPKQQHNTVLELTPEDLRRMRSEAEEDEKARKKKVRAGKFGRG